MIYISYLPNKKDKFILVTNNSIGDVASIPQFSKPVKCINGSGIYAGGFCALACVSESHLSKYLVGSSAFVKQI